MDLATLLAEFAAIPAPSGAETELAAALQDRWAPRCEEIRRDAVGNVIARVGGAGPRVLVQAHMDQVGYVVRFVTDAGFLLLDGAQGDRSRGPERRHHIGQPVKVLTRDGVWIEGVLVAASGHVLTTAQREEHRLGYDDFWVERGRSKEALTEAGVHPGAPVIFASPTRRLGDLLVGPSMDNRVGLTLMDALIGTESLACELWLAATVQEENGLHGAYALARAERFDAAIALDVGLVGDVPGVEEREHPSALGQGPIVVHRDSLIAYDRVLSQHLVRLARTHGIPVQDAVFSSYGSDGLTLAQAGSPTALLTVGTRYTHTAFETIHPADLSATFELVRALVTSELPAR
jgi:endoglucanase